MGKLNDTIVPFSTPWLQWDDNLLNIQLGLNGSVNSAIGVTPSEALMGFRVMHTGALNDAHAVVDVTKIREKIMLKTKEYQLQQKKRFDSKRKAPPTYTQGDLVMIRVTSNPATGTSQKLLPKWIATIVTGRCSRPGFVRQDSALPLADQREGSVRVALGFNFPINSRRRPKLGLEWFNGSSSSSFTLVKFGRVFCVLCESCVDSVDVCSVLGRHLFRLRKRTSAKVRHLDTDVTFDADRTGWEGPVKGNKRLPDSNQGFSPLKIRNSFEPLNLVPETMDSAAAGTSSSPIETSSKRRDAGKTNKVRPPPPPVIIHGFVENFNDLEQMLRRNIGKKYSIKFTRKNTTIYTQNKVKNVLSQTETSYHSFTHKDEKTHAFVLQGLGQNPSVEEVQNAIKEEHHIETIKMYKMRGTNRPKYLVITDKTITQNQLETQARTSHLGPRRSILAPVESLHQRRFPKRSSGPTPGSLRPSQPGPRRPKQWRKKSPRRKAKFRL
jgi:hypothetical protein